MFIIEPYVTSNNFYFLFNTAFGLCDEGKGISIHLNHCLDSTLAPVSESLSKSIFSQIDHLEVDSYADLRMYNIETFPRILSVQNNLLLPKMKHIDVKKWPKVIKARGIFLDPDEYSDLIFVNKFKRKYKDIELIKKWWV